MGRHHDWTGKLPIAGSLLLLPVAEVIAHVTGAGLVVTGMGLTFIYGAGWVLYLKVRDRNER